MGFLTVGVEQILKERGGIKHGMSLVCAQSMQEGNEFALFFLSPLFSFSAALIKKSESEGNQGEWKFFSLANLQTVFKKCQ